MTIDKYIFREVDPEQYIIATYSMWARQNEYKKAATAIAIGQSIGNPDVRTHRDSPKLLENHLAKIIELRGQGNFRNQPTIVKIAYPLVNFGEEDGVNQLLCTLMGGQMDIDIIKMCRLIDIKFPKTYLTDFSGPKLGMNYIKNKSGAIGRPLLGGIIKPKTGISIPELEELVRELLEGSIDFIKEDEILGNPRCCPFKERVPRIADLVRDYASKEGREIFYAPCINGDNFLERAEFAAENGANIVHLNIHAGLSAYKKIRDLDLPVGIFFQKSGDKIITEREHRYGIDWPVICQLARISGVDMMHAGMWGGYLSDSKEDLERILKVLDGESSYKSTVPSLSCGSHPGLVDTTVYHFGENLMMNVGGAIHGHPMGTTAGVVAMKQAMAKPFGEDMNEYMKDKPELKTAIEKWGYTPLK